MRRTLTVCLALFAFLAACDERPGNRGPDPSASTTPVIDQLHALWDSLDHTKLEPTAYLYPKVPGLEFDASAPAGSHDRLIASLTTLQPTVKQLLELTRQTPEQFPPPLVPTDQDPDAHMRHPIAWCQNFARLLQADSGRCWEASDYDGAAVRLSAVIRLGNSLQDQDDSFPRVVGLGIVGQAVVKALAMSDQDLVSHLSKPALGELQAAAQSVRISGEFQDLGGAVKPDLERLCQLLKR